MTTPATASSLREATSPEALTCARRRLLTVSPVPTGPNAVTQGSLTDEQLRLRAASDWLPPRIAALDANTIATADAITRALLAESVREGLERRLTAERPHGTYDDTRAGHDAFSRGVVEDYDHGNHHLARATIRPADPGLVTRAALSALGLPDTNATIIDELAQASDPNPIMRVLSDAALLDLDRYATGAGLLYSSVGTTLMFAAPSDQRLAEAIDAVATAAIGAGARLTDVTTQYIDEEKALASIGIDPWATRPGDEPTGQADRILYVGRDGARVHVKAGRVLVDAPGSLPATSVPKNSVTRIVLSGNVGLSAGARSWAMRSGVDVVCLSRRGSYQGALIGANRGTHASRLLAQVALTGDHERRVRLAASLIGAKIRGQIHVLTRIARRDETVHVADTTAHMHAWRRSLTDARKLDEVMGIEGACSNAYFDALAACVPADVTFDGRSRRPPRDLPNAALCSTGTRSSCPNASARCTPPGSNHHSASPTHPPTNAPAWRWTSWSSSADSWSTKPSWLSYARANAGPYTASSRPTPGECGWEPTARKTSSTPTRPPVSDPSPAPCPDTPGRGAGTSPTPHKCWRAPSPIPTTSGAGSPGDDLHGRLRHRRQQTAPPRRQNTGILGLPHPRIRVPTPPRQCHAGSRACSAHCPHLRRRRRHPHLPHLLILRRPRRHTRRSHSAGRCGVVSGSVVRASVVCDRLLAVTIGMSTPGCIGLIKPSTVDLLSVQTSRCVCGLILQSTSSLLLVDGVNLLSAAFRLLVFLLCLHFCKKDI